MLKAKMLLDLFRWARSQCGLVFPCGAILRKRKINLRKNDGRAATAIASGATDRPSGRKTCLPSYPSSPRGCELFRPLWKLLNPAHFWARQRRLDCPRRMNYVISLKGNGARAWEHRVLILCRPHFSGPTAQGGADRTSSCDWRGRRTASAKRRFRAKYSNVLPAR